jgi:hypothetical protein
MRIFYNYPVKLKEYLKVVQVYTVPKKRFVKM